jgi:hypothetical protein
MEDWRYSSTILDLGTASAAAVFRCPSADTNAFPLPDCSYGKITELPME